VALARLAQGQESEIDIKTFHEIIEGAHATFGAKRRIIEGAHATFGAKRRIHSGTSVTQAGEQHMPISANPGAVGRPLMSRKRSCTEGKAPVKGSNEKPGCGFCDQKGHNITSCNELKRYGERIRSEQDLRRLSDELLSADGQFLATRIPNEVTNKPRRILQTLPTEAKFLAIHKKYIINNDLVGPVGIQNLYILVTFIGAGGRPIPECSRVLAQASIVSGWMIKSKNKYKSVISSLARDAFLQTQEPDAMREPHITACSGVD
jgi:hypothetical protein